MMLHRMKLGPKLTGSFVVVSLILAIIVVMAYSSLQKAHQLQDTLYADRLVPIKQLGNANAAALKIRGDIYKFILLPKERQKIEDDIRKGIATVDQELGAYRATYLVEAEKAELPKFDAAWADYQSEYEKINRLVRAEDDRSALQSLLEGGAASHARKALGNSLDALIKINAQVAAELAKEAEATTSQAKTALIFAGLVAVTLALGLAIFLTRSITGPMAKGVAMMQELGQGHLGKRLNMNRRDEIGVLATTMDQFAADLQNRVVGTMKKIAEGDVSMELKATDSQDEITTALKQMAETWRGLAEEVERLSRAAVEGRWNTRGDADKFTGDCRAIVKGINDILDAVIKPVQEASQILGEMSRGDLTSAVKGDYPGDHALIKEALNGTLSSLNDVLLQVNLAVEQVTAGSQQVSDASQALAQGAMEQASSLEEVTASMTEMASHTEQTAQNAARANQWAQTARTTAEQGNAQMQGTLGAMKEINESAGQICKIIKVIDEIAFQTNLLALNAAVEAARAGVHGKGFAVVADEVRNLAQRSAKAAKETTELIEGSVKKAENGTAIANKTGEALAEIVQGITKVTDLIGEIASASTEQAQGIEQITEALGQIDQVTQTNAASAEESAAAAEELSSQAVQLKQGLTKFQLRGQTTSGPYVQVPAHVDRLVKTLQQQQIRPATGAKTRRPRSAEIIALDDDDFGKF